MHSIFSSNTKGNYENWENGGEISKTISCKLPFIESVRFIASSLSNLVNNLTEGIHKIKCNYEHDDKKRQTCGIKFNDMDCFLEHTIFKNDLKECKCLCCKKNYRKRFDENLKKRSF